MENIFQPKKRSQSRPYPNDRSSNLHNHSNFNSLKIQSKQQSSISDLFEDSNSDIPNDEEKRKIIILLYKIFSKGSYESRNSVTKIFSRLIFVFSDKPGGGLMLRALTQMNQVTPQYIKIYSNSPISSNVVAAYDSLFITQFKQQVFDGLDKVLADCNSENPALRGAACEFLIRNVRDPPLAYLTKIAFQLVKAIQSYLDKNALLLTFKFAEKAELLYSGPIMNTWLVSEPPVASKLLPLFLIISRSQLRYSQLLFKHVYAMNFLLNAMDSISSVLTVAWILVKYPAIYENLNDLSLPKLNAINQKLCLNFVKVIPNESTNNDDVWRNVDVMAEAIGRTAKVWISELQLVKGQINGIFSLNGVPEPLKEKIRNLYRYIDQLEGTRRL